MANSQREESNHQVVQCPACETKFSVEETKMGVLDCPRFHCSRCDFVFEVSPTEEFQEEDEMAYSRLYGGLSSEADEVTVTSSEGLPMSQSTDSSTQISSSSSFSIPDSIEDDFFEAPHESLENSDANQMEFSFPKVEAPKKLSLNIPKISKPSMDFSEEVNKVPAYNTELFAEGGEEENTQLSYPIPGSFERNDSLEEQIADIPWAKRRCGVATVAIPILVLLAVLAGTTGYIRSNPERANTIASSILPSGRAIAPAGLQVSGLSFDTIKLDSGERLQIVRGSIINSTEQAFQNIKIQGLAFDSTGNMISEMQTNASPILNESKLSSLSADRIAMIQSEANAIVIKPGITKEFAVALTDDQAQKARFYSARIYSVQNA